MIKSASFFLGFILSISLARAEAIKQVQSISGEFGSFCAILKDGSLWCWGYNIYGQLGLGDVENRSIPERVNFDQKVLSIKFNGSYSCALLEDRSLWCAGANNAGSLGIGNDEPQTRFQKVKLAKKVLEFQTGLFSACALDETRDLWCWGENSYGQLGIGNQELQWEPVLVPLKQKVKSFSTNGLHTCAVLEDQSLSCWGDHSMGQLGIGNQPTPVVSPQKTNISGKARQVVLSAGNSCVILEDGSLWCSGENSMGQLGIGDLPGQSEFKKVKLHDAAASVYLTQDAACAVTAKRDVWCWGNHFNGQLGISDTIMTPALEPAMVKLNGKVVSFSKNFHSCAVLEDGSLWCWGSGFHGQMGSQMPKSEFLPFRVLSPGYLSVRSVLVSWDNTCAVFANHLAKCWGDNGYGQLGVEGLGPSYGSMPRQSIDVLAWIDFF